MASWWIHSFVRHQLPDPLSSKYNRDHRNCSFQPIKNCQSMNFCHSYINCIVFKAKMSKKKCMH